MLPMPMHHFIGPSQLPHISDHDHSRCSQVHNCFKHLCTTECQVQTYRANGNHQSLLILGLLSVEEMDMRQPAVAGNHFK